MGISRYPSRVSLPRAKKPYPTILDYLAQRFPKVGRALWEERLLTGKVFDEGNMPIDKDTPYVPQKRLFYFREVAEEPVIPLAEKILFQNDEILVVCKPPFLPVTPGGAYVNECLLNRLRKATGNHALVPLHRIDRETSGLVLFSMNEESRGRYGQLFLTGQIEKSYEAICRCGQRPQASQWSVNNRLVDDEVWFRSKVVAGPVNARSRINLLEVKGNRAYFLLSPLTGKKHQLRVHMSGLGFPILNDRYYPELLPKQDDDLANPLQLVARRLAFTDPVSGQRLSFQSERKLLWDPGAEQPLELR